jgi:GT2 family glycosyltransferase
MFDLCVIIVNWNTKKALFDCLASVYSNTKNITYEVIIVDNASTDGSTEETKIKYPFINIIENERNLGFAKSLNKGIKQSKSKYVLSLNSDARITEEVLESMVKFMDDNNRVGIAGAQLIKEDGKLQNSFDNIPNLITALLNKKLFRLLFPSRYPSKKEQPDKPFEVESVVGACMIIRPDALKQTGLLDENYFVFLEETDLCLQMRKHGWKVMVLPDSKVYHLQGETKKQILISAKIEYLNSLYKFFLKNKPYLSYLFLRLLYPIRLLLQLDIAILLFLVTFGQVRSLRLKCYMYFCLFAWHMMGYPESITLKGISLKRQKKVSQ